MRPKGKLQDEVEAALSQERENQNEGPREYSRLNPEPDWTKKPKRKPRKRA